MSHPAVHHQINYIEFSTSSIEKSKAFYSSVFGWVFKEWGPDYIDCHPSSAGIAIGFAKGEPDLAQAKGAPVVVLYSADLKATEAAIMAAGGKVVVPAFEFPGGRRFHFADGLGNTLAVWSE